MKWLSVKYSFDRHFRLPIIEFAQQDFLFLKLPFDRKDARPYLNDAACFYLIINQKSTTYVIKLWKKCVNNMQCIFVLLLYLTSQICQSVNCLRWVVVIKVTSGQIPACRLHLSGQNNFRWQRQGEQKVAESLSLLHLVICHEIPK